MTKHSTDAPGVNATRVAQVHSNGGSTNERRRFISRVAAALALVPVAAGAAESAPAVSPPEPEFNLQQYNRDTMEHLFLMAEMMYVWFKVHEDGIREFYSNDAGRQGYDLFFNGHTASRQLQRATGIQLDQEYLQQFANRCKASAKSFT